jgi:hypothetical protein
MYDWAVFVSWTQSVQCCTNRNQSVNLHCDLQMFQGAAFSLFVSLLHFRPFLPSVKSLLGYPIIQICIYKLVR